MEILGLMVIASIMAIFGAMGYVRGGKATFAMIVATLIGLIFWRTVGPQVVRMVNFIGRFIIAGGFSALAGGSDPAKALGEVIAKMGKLEPLINPNQPGIGFVIILATFGLIGFAASAVKLLGLKGKSSLNGLILGLVNGYLFTAYGLAALAPALAMLPLPIPLPNLKTLPVTSSAGASSSGGNTVGRLTETLGGLSDNPAIPIIIALTIIVFIFVATRSGSGGSGGGKKG